MRQALNNHDLVAYLKATHALRTQRVVQAFLAVDRKNFVPPEFVGQAYGDYPLSIGSGQTISQPSTVAFMLELLQPSAGQAVLEVGAGSGYVAALAAKIVGEQGSVLAIERIPELVELARRNLRAYHLPQLAIERGDGSQGAPGNQTFDRILVSAAAPKLPQPLVAQLKEGGRLVVPVGTGFQTIVVIERRQGQIKQQHYPGFLFVPLVEDVPE